MSRLYRLVGIKGRSSHSGRRILAAKVLAKTGQVEVVQRLLGHAEPDHVCRTLTLINRPFDTPLSWRYSAKDISQVRAAGTEWKN